MASLVYNNVLPWRGCEQLYLNGRTSDVNFICGSEKVPAHKNILAIISPVFDAMFYGPNRQDGDIEIVDASATAFKEFLQFFYRHQVQLTAEYVSEVLGLGRRYLLDDWQTVSTACIDLCESTLTLDDMCVGYELAILFEMNELKQFCEKQIGENAAKTFRSSSFLNCRPNLLGHILQLDSLQCDESTVFDGCMAWAKAECGRKQCDENDMQNLRTQLGDLFYEIRFGDFSQEHFEQRYRLHDGLFSLEEFRDITMMITRNDFQPAKFNRSSRPQAKRDPLEGNASYIVCERKRTKNISSSRLSLSTMRFVTTSQLMLKRIVLYCRLVDRNKTIKAQIRIHEDCTQISRGRFVSLVESSIKAYEENEVDLPAPILIEPGVMYEIDVELDSSVRAMHFKQCERLVDGTIIEFSDVYSGSLVNALHFVRCKN